MKKLMASILALVLVFALFACGDSEPKNSATPKPSATPVVSDTGGDIVGELVVDDETETGIIDSATVGTSWMLASMTPFRAGAGQHMPIMRYLYDRLVYSSSDGYITQGAKSYEVADDGVTWSVEIYDYIYDSEGNHITASDIVWFFEGMMANGMKPAYANVASIKQTGDYTFEVVMKGNVATQLEEALVATFLVSKEAFEASPDGFAGAIVSTSPYKVTKFAPDSSITFELRDDYWQKAELIHPLLQTNIRELNIILINEASQQQIALETETIDSFAGINPTIVDAFMANENYHVMRGASNNSTALYFSGHESRLTATDENLRKAIIYALDTEGLIAGAANGFAELMHDAAPRTTVGYFSEWDESEYFRYDPKLAKEYLDKSSYNGEELVIMGGSTTQRLCTMIQAYLADVGINLKIDLLDTALFTASNMDGSLYDMVINSVGNTIPHFWQTRYHMNAFSGGDGNSRRDAELTALIEHAWQNENFNLENASKVRDYVIDKAYAYGMYLPSTITVTSSDLNMVGTAINIQGMLDLPACTFAVK